MLFTGCYIDIQQDYGMKKYEFIKNLGSSVRISRVSPVEGKPGERTGWHAHYNRLHLAFIESGRGEYEMNGRIWQLRAGTTIVTLPGEFHEFRVDERFPYSAWFIYLEWLADYPEFLPRCIQVSKKVFTLLNKLAGEYKKNSDPLLQYGLLLEILSMMDNSENLTDSSRLGMEPAWAPVFKALHGPPFNYPGIDALSEIRGVSRKSFTQWFRKVTGQSVKEYYLDKVMTYADKMLLENMPQKELAERCGFSNAQNFMKAWRDYHSGNKNKSGGGFRN